MSILIIDNYDSFVHTLARYVRLNDLETMIYRNDEITAERVRKLNPAAIIISPGPCTPNDAGNCLSIIKECKDIPMLGVCLGHQAIAQSFGANIVRADRPVHGMTSKISHNNNMLYRNIPTTFEAARYHSLIVEKDTLPPCFVITSQTNDGIIMGLRHKEYPLHGVQFHPESFLTNYGKTIINNFVNLAREDKIS